MSAPKGYVVRGTDSDGESVCEDFQTIGDAIRLLRDANRCVLSIFAVSADGTETKLPSYEEALATLDAIAAAIFADALPRADLPSLVKQYAKICEDAAVEIERARTSDPLAALEAAERRLLESARWTPGDRGFWVDPDDGTQWPRESAISDVRQRLAAKGGA